MSWESPFQSHKHSQTQSCTGRNKISIIMLTSNLYSWLTVFLITLYTDFFLSWMKSASEVAWFVMLWICLYNNWVYKLYIEICDITQLKNEFVWKYMGTLQKKIIYFLSYLLVLLISLHSVFPGIFLMPFELKAFWEFFRLSVFD